jgi:hypothetical protein
MGDDIRVTDAVDDARPAPHLPRRRRRWWLTATVVALVIAAAGAAVVVTRLDATATAAGDAANAPHPSTARVERSTVTAQQRVNGTLGYAGDYDVVGRLGGTITALPQAGALLNAGDVLYRIDDTPVILLDGALPAWRELGVWGRTGADVRQLNAALVALGHADGLGLDPASDKTTWATRQAIMRLQKAYGLTQTGTLEQGRVVFLPGALRVASVAADTGSSADPGQPVLTATSTTPQVRVELPVTLAPRVAAGDAVSVWMPDLSTAEGTVRSVGTVANAPTDGTTATVPLLVDLADPSVAENLDQAPVMVGITTDTVTDVLTVPVTALLAVAGGGYAVEVVEGATTRLVDVELGLFDTAGGIVEVTGAELAEGQTVVVPGS